MIGVLGSTGYTGRLVLAELRRRNIEARAGVRADIDDPAFYEDLDAVISVVGPYAEAGMPVVDAAVANGIPYVDASGEIPYVRAVLDRHADATVPVIPGCGFYGLVGDLAAAVSAEHFGGPVDEIAINYSIHRASISRGAARSVLGDLLSADAPTPGPRRRAWFPGGSRWVVDAPFVESVLVPRHVPGATVTTGMAVPGRVATLAPRATTLARRVAPALAWAVERLPAGPADDRRLAMTFQVVAEATGSGPRCFVLCEGRDPYGLTALLLVTAALGASRAGQRPGAMAPAEAFEAERFLNAVSGPMLRWSFELPEPGDLSA